MASHVVDRRTCSEVTLANANGAVRCVHMWLLHTSCHQLFACLSLRLFEMLQILQESSPEGLQRLQAQVCSRVGKAHVLQANVALRVFGGL